MKQVYLILLAISIVIVAVAGIFLYNRKEKYDPSTGAIPAGTLDKNCLVADSSGNLSLTSAVPVGGIIMWSGQLADLAKLEGWALCDGTNGTPDLRSKFVVGVGSSNPNATALGSGLTAHKIGDTGGEETHMLQGGEMPSHTHASMQGLGPSGGYLTQASQAGFSWLAEDSLRILGIGKGDNSDNLGTPYQTGPNGGGVPHNNMPPYYALAFLMKRF
jgi:microcystin-dependent protein